jgi:small-conductance mechanosensitive channel
VRGIIDDDRHRSDVRMTGFGDSALNFELLVWVGPDVIRTPSRVESEALWALDDELRAADLEVPFPQRDLHIRSGLPAAPPDHAEDFANSGKERR